MANKEKQSSGEGVFIGGLIAGALLGCACGLLSTPRTGEGNRRHLQARGQQLVADTREKVTETTVGVRETVGGALGEVKQNVEQATTNLRVGAEDAISTARSGAAHASEDVRARVGGAVATVRETSEQIGETARHRANALTDIRLDHLTEDEPASH